MKEASEGPVRSVNSKCRFPGTRARRCRDGPRSPRAPHHLVAVLHAADPDAALGALQLQDRERLRRADDRIPHLERYAAMGADHRPVALGTVRLQRRVPPRALGSGLLAGLAARRRRRLRARRRGPFAGTTVPAADVAARCIAPAAKEAMGRATRSEAPSLR